MADDRNLSVLALDSAGSACSAALWRAGGIVARRLGEMEHGHAESLVPMVQAVMTEAGHRYEALDAVAVTVGPGSYTGVRVGLAAARALASAAGKPLTGVTSFDAVRAAVRERGPLLIALDTRRADLYVQAFDAGGEAETKPAIVTEAELPELFDGLDPILVAGDAAERALAVLQAAGHAGRMADAPRHADAGRVAALAAERLALEGAPRPAEPLYLRPPDARTAAERARLAEGAAAHFLICEPVHGPVVARLQQACFDEHWSAEGVTALLSQPGVAGLLLTDAASQIPIGYALLRSAGGEAEILSFGIEARYRRRGHGRRLLAETRALAERAGAGALFLEVAESNLAARTLYESQGFAPAGRRIGYYRGPRGVDNALTLRLDLAPRKSL